MKITWKCTKQGYEVVVNGCTYKFTTSKEAWDFIINTQKGVA